MCGDHAQGAAGVRRAAAYGLPHCQPDQLDYNYPPRADDMHMRGEMVVWAYHNPQTVDAQYGGHWRPPSAPMLSGMR